MDDNNNDWEDVPLTQNNPGNSGNTAGTEDDWEEVPVAQGPSVLDQVKDTGVGTGAGAATGYVAKETARLGKKAYDAVTPSELMGRLNKDQMDFISSDVNRWKNPENIGLENLYNEYKGLVSDIKNQRNAKVSELEAGLGDTSKQVNEKSYELAKTAKKSLQGLPPVPTSQLHKSVGDALLSGSDYATAGAVLSSTPEEFEKEVRQVMNSSAKKFEPISGQIQNLNQEILDLEEKSGFLTPDSNLDQHLKIRKELEAKQAQKLAKEQELGNLLNTVKADARKQVEKSHGIPDSLVKSNPGLKNKKLAPGYSLDNVMSLIGSDPAISPERVGGRLGIIKQLQDGLPGELTGDESTGTKFSKSVSDSIRKNFVEDPTYQEYAENQAASSKAIKTQEQLEALGIKLDGQGNPVMSSSARGNISRWLDDPEKYAPELRRLEDALANARDIGATVPESFDDIKPLMAAENQFAAVGVRPNTQTGKLEFPESKRENFVEALTSGKNTDEAANVIESIKSAARLQGVPESELDTVVKYVQEQAKIGEIRGIIDESRIPGYIATKSRGALAKSFPALVGSMVGAGAGGAGGGTAGAGIGAVAGGVGSNYLIEKYGTDLQRMLAEFKGSKFAQKSGDFVNALGKSKALPVVGGLIGALTAGSDAQAAGYSPEGVAAVSAAEAVNPLPFTDVFQATEAVKNIPEETLQNASGSAQNYTPGGMPAQAAIVSGEALKGFTKPLRDIGGLAAEGLDNAGTARSNDARSRMEQNLNAFKQLRSDKSALVSPEKMSPDQLNQLAEQFKSMTGGGQGFANDLMKAARATDEDAKNRIMHGLTQQPAFRQMMERLKK